jgi:hypothetical protein
MVYIYFNGLYFFILNLMVYGSFKSTLYGFTLVYFFAVHQRLFIVFQNCLGSPLALSQL